MLDIVNLTEINIEKFWNYVLEDVPLYFFFILDQKQFPENSQFLIALDEEEIVGLCLIWKKEHVHIRGNDEEILEVLFRSIPENLPIKVINFEYKYRELLYALVPKPKSKVSLHRMLLNKENMISRYTLDKPFTQKVLDKKDAPAIANLMRKADPFFWGKVKAETLTFAENKTYTGLFDGKNLISFTSAWIDETAAIIGTAATLPKYQNQGLATYLVNETIHNMVDKTEIAIIQVITENAPAIKVYSKVGYEIYATFAMAII